MRTTPAMATHRRVHRKNFYYGLTALLMLLALVNTALAIDPGATITALAFGMVAHAAAY